MATTDTTHSSEPTALQLAASMAQGLLPLIGPLGLPASALVSGALQLAQMFNGAGKTVTMADLEKIAATTQTNLDAFGRKVDARFPGA